jgi:hypothetical protein
MAAYDNGLGGTEFGYVSPVSILFPAIHNNKNFTALLQVLQR